MARRMYLSTNAGAVTITPHAAWLESTASATTKYSGVAKQNTGLTLFTSRIGGTLTGGYRWMSFLTDPLREDYNFTQEITVSMVISGLEGSDAEDAHLAFILRAMEGNTSTQRGLLASFLGTSTEFVTSAETRIFWSRSFSADVFALAGDRLCLEIGIWVDTPTSAANVGLRFGDPTATADFALTEGLTTDLDPWWEITADVEFTTDPVFATASPSIRLALVPAAVRTAFNTTALGITLSLAPVGSVSLQVAQATPSIRLSFIAAANPLAQASPSIRLTLGPATTLGTVAAVATPRIVLALTLATSQSHAASAAPRIRVAIPSAHAIGGFVLAGGTVVDLEYNVSGSTVTGNQQITFTASGVSTIELRARE